MSYNPRMSMVPNTQQQNRGRKKEEESDAFMRLVRDRPHPSQNRVANQISPTKKS